MRRLSLQRRMVAASALLALVVGGVFIALILALSDLHAAREQEARSKQVTAAAFALQSHVQDAESSLRGYVFQRAGRGFSPAYTNAMRRATREPRQLRRGHASVRLGKDGRPGY